MREAPKTTRTRWILNDEKTRLDLEKEESLVFTASAASGLYEIDVVRSTAGNAKALAERSPTTRDVMEMHRLLAHTNEAVTKDTAKKVGVALTRRVGTQWGMFQGKRMPARHAEEDGREGDAGGTTTLHRSGWADARDELGRQLVCDDRPPRLHAIPREATKFIKKKSDSTAALLSYIANYITPKECNIGAIRTDNGGEFKWQRQRRRRRNTSHWRRSRTKYCSSGPDIHRAGTGRLRHHHHGGQRRRNQDGQQ